MQRAYKRQLVDLYDADDEDEVTPSGKRQKPAPADGDTTVTSQDSPPVNQEVDLPWGPVESLSDSESEPDDIIIKTPPHYYDDVDEEAIASSPAHEKEDDDDFTYSPASPPLIASMQVERASSASPPRLYVFPDETVVVTPDGGHIHIPDQHTITHPKPSTSTIEDDADHDNDEDESAEDSRKVCFIQMQTNIARLIAHQWRISAPSTVEEVTVDVCRSLAVTVLSAAYQDILMKYVRCAIRRPR